MLPEAIFQMTFHPKWYMLMLRSFFSDAALLTQTRQKPSNEGNMYILVQLKYEAGAPEEKEWYLEEHKQRLI